MGLTVKQLIKELRRFPPDAVVAWQDHDQPPNEINARVSYLRDFDPATSFDPDFCAGIGVVLRP